MQKYLMIVLLGLTFVGCTFTNEPDPGFASMDDGFSNASGAAEPSGSGGEGGGAGAGGELGFGGAGGGLAGAGGAGGGTGGAGGSTSDSETPPELDGGVGGNDEPADGGGDDPSDGGEIRPVPAECGRAGICAPNGGWCEPAGRPECQATPGQPVCYPPDDALSLRFCGERPDCGALGMCTDTGSYCEPEGPEACHANPGFPVCYPPDDPTSLRYCGRDVDCSVLGLCAPNGGWCEPQGPEACHLNPGFPVCYLPDHPTSQMYCAQRPAPDCGALGTCTNGAYCEPQDEEACQMDPGFPVCYDADHPTSQMYCEQPPPAPDCGALGTCTNGAYCEPEDEEACQSEPGFPVCYPADHPTSQMYCGQRPAGQCADDRDCRDGWCRPLEGGGSSCVPWQMEDGRCNGRVLAHTRERCGPGFTCTDYPIRGGDLPGFCRQACMNHGDCPDPRRCDADGICRDVPDCSELGNCGPMGQWCEPVDEPLCQRSRNAALCYEPQHEDSIRYCAEGNQPRQP